MELRRLLYFARIAEDGSLTKAAGVLRVAQPALSRQLRLLEEELGVTLFTRTARGVRMTEEGAYLHAASLGPLRALELALQNVRSLSSGVQGDLAIGMPSGLVDVLAKPFVFAMAAEFPDIRLRVVEGPTGSLIDWLNRGIIDLAILDDAAADDRLVDAPLLSQPLMLVGGRASELDPGRPVSFHEAARLPLIVPSHHLGIRATINRAATKARVSLAIRLESDSVSLITDLLEHGDGYAFLPLMLVEAKVAEARLRAAPVISPELTFAVFLTTGRRDHASASKVEDAVLGVLRKLATDIADRTGADDCAASTAVKLLDKTP